MGISELPIRIQLKGAGNNIGLKQGNKRVTIRNAKVVKVDADRNLLFLKGGIPGGRNSYIRILKRS